MYNREELIKALDNQKDLPIIGEGSSRGVLGWNDLAIKYPLTIQAEFEDIASFVDLAIFNERFKKTTLEKQEKDNYKAIQDFLSKARVEEKLSQLNGINQSIFEYLSFIFATEDEKSVLLKIIDFFFYNEEPVIVMPKVTTVEDHLNEIQYDSVDYHYVDNEFYWFRRYIAHNFPAFVTDICTDNCGFFEGKTVIIDYGLSSSSNFSLI